MAARSVPSKTLSKEQQAALDQAMFECLRNKDVDSLKICLSRGANVHAQLKVWRNGATQTLSISHEAVDNAVLADQLGDILLAHGADLNIVDDRGRTPLILATIKRKSEDIKYLLSKNVDVHIKDKAGNTALWHAVTSPSPVEADIQRLLAAGADPLSQNAQGEVILAKVIELQNAFSNSGGNRVLKKVFADLVRALPDNTVPSAGKDFSIAAEKEMRVVPPPLRHKTPLQPPEV